jgi:hypothetical protein
MAARSSRIRCYLQRQGEPAGLRPGQEQPDQQAVPGRQRKLETNKLLVSNTRSCH